MNDDLSGVVAKQLGLGFKLEGRVSRELWEVRRVLELDVVALAAERATLQEVEQIEGVLTQMQAAAQAQDWCQLEQLDPRFHLAIVDACHNNILSGLVRNLNDLSQQMVMDAPFREENLALHHDLLRTLKDRNPEAARTVMSAILDDTRQSLEFDE